MFIQAEGHADRDAASAAFREVSRTEKVSAAFIKELIRRSVQFQLERDGTGGLTREDVENALDEMLFSGGSLNVKLLGGNVAGSGRVGFV